MYIFLNIFILVKYDLIFKTTASVSFQTISFLNRESDIVNDFIQLQSERVSD